MKSFLHPEHDKNLELSLDDVFIVPSYFEGSSRHEVDLTPKDGLNGCSNPLVSANMNAVTGKRMAETMARYGGLGVLPQDMSYETVERIFKHIKSANVRYDTPITVKPDDLLKDAYQLIQKKSHNLIAVVDDDGALLGIVTLSDLNNKDKYCNVKHIMRKNVQTLPHDISYEYAYLLLEDQRLHAAPVIFENKLIGVLTKEDALRYSLLPPALSNNKLMLAAAIGISENVEENARKLYELGIDAIILDTAHGHQKKMLEAIRIVKSVVKGNIAIVAGNVCTSKGARELGLAGADIIKVNVGPGAMCTTRMQTGVGRPTFSAVLDCVGSGMPIWADGGVKNPRDVALYLAAGASRVMLGTILCGTYESPPEMKKEDHLLYKENYGMASTRAVSDRNAALDAYTQAKRKIFQEGISTSKIFLKEGQESVGDIVMNILSGVRSACTYTNSTNLYKFAKNAIIGTQTASGFYEGTPHGKVRK